MSSPNAPPPAPPTRKPTCAHLCRALPRGQMNQVVVDVVETLALGHWDHLAGGLLAALQA